MCVCVCVCASQVPDVSLERFRLTFFANPLDRAMYASRTGRWKVHTHTHTHTQTEKKELARRIGQEGTQRVTDGHSRTQQNQRGLSSGVLRQDGSNTETHAHTQNRTDTQNYAQTQNHTHTRNHTHTHTDTHTSSSAAPYVSPHPPNLSSHPNSSAPIGTAEVRQQGATATAL